MLEVLEVLEVVVAAVVAAVVVVAVVVGLVVVGAAIGARFGEMVWSVDVMSEVLVAGMLKRTKMALDCEDGFRLRR